MSPVPTVSTNRSRRAAKRSEQSFFLGGRLEPLTKRNDLRAARFLFALVYSFLFLFGSELHFHARMGCDSCPVQEFVVFQAYDGTPSIGRDDFCDQCRRHDDFCPACHFFSVFRFFTTVALAFLTLVLLKRKLWDDERRVVSWHRVFLRRSRAPPQVSAL